MVNLCYLITGPVYTHQYQSCVDIGHNEETAAVCIHCAGEELAAVLAAAAFHHVVVACPQGDIALQIVDHHIVYVLPVAVVDWHKKQN